MKTKEFIRQLQKADPSGEIECCIDNADILFVDVMEAYWDGRLQTLIREEETGKAIGVKVTSNGWKLKLLSHSVEDVLLDNPDAEVILDLEGPMLTDYQERVARRRKEAKEIWKKVDEDYKTFQDSKSKTKTNWLGKLFCFFGLHKWEGKIVDQSSSRKCKRCDISQRRSCSESA